MITKEIRHSGPLTTSVATHSEKVRARKALNHAVENGRIVSQPCEQCKALPTQGHHDDYSKALEVRWLCSACHGKFHQKHPDTSVCEVCEKVFTPAPTKRARAKVCSWECRSALLSKIRTENPTIPGFAKLDKEKAAAIRARYAAGGVTHRALALTYGVHHKQIGSVIRGEAWK